MRDGGDMKEDILRTLKSFGEDVDELANWLSAFSRILKRYILPYIKELGEKLTLTTLMKCLKK